LITKFTKATMIARNLGMNRLATGTRATLGNFPMKETPISLLASPDFHRLVARRWRISMVLTLCLFVLYYGFILLVGLNRAFLAQRVGAITIGIPLAASVILGAWVLTAIYVVWANRAYDPAVRALRDRLH
jgi:uncharacterized membrane protein (DUF485 family)